MELQYKDSRKSSTESKDGNVPRQRSVFVGWTGMQSQRRLAFGVDRGVGRNISGSMAETAVVEIDATFGRMLGLGEGQKVIFLVSLR